MNSVTSVIVWQLVGQNAHAVFALWVTANTPTVVEFNDVVTNTVAPWVGRSLRTRLTFWNVEFICKTKWEYFPVHPFPTSERTVHVKITHASPVCPSVKWLWSCAMILTGEAGLIGGNLVPVSLYPLQIWYGLTEIKPGPPRWEARN